MSSGPTGNSGHGGFTGRHMTAILVVFFAVVIAVNVAMARLATSTFGGVVVDNSYVASQHFNRWLDEAAAEKKLGWQADFTRRADGRLAVKLVGPSPSAQLAALARHPLGRQPDRSLAFVRDGSGAFVSTGPLPAGRWRLRFEVHADGRIWRSEGDIL